jgi:hypothetical protein
MVSTIPAAYFGMNLFSGFEAAPGIFWPIVQGSLAVGGITAGSIWGYFKFGPKRRYQARLRDMRSLRDLLYFHMDYLEEVLEAVREHVGVTGTVSRKEFGKVVRGALKGRSPMTPEEEELLWRVFDQNRSGFLELSEMVRLEDQVTDLTNLEHHVS